MTFLGVKSHFMTSKPKALVCCDDEELFAGIDGRLDKKCIWSMQETE